LVAVLPRKIHRQLRLADAAKAVHDSNFASARCALYAGKKRFKLLHLCVLCYKAVHYGHVLQAEVDFVFASICCTWLTFCIL
jgi:hypothetical protein